MNRTLKLYGIIFAVVLAVLALLEVSKSEVMDWRKNYDENKKSPFGLYIFNQESAEIFNNKLKKAQLSPYEYYEKNTQKKPHNILIIETDLDEESWTKILTEVGKGSNLMVISDGNHYRLFDTLEISANQVNFEDQNTLFLTESKFKKDSLHLDKFPNRKGFKILHKNNEILGGVSARETQDANFVKFKLGKGNIYYHTEPLFLTNYYLLKPKSENYLQNVFSYFPEQETIWFKEKKQSFSGGELSFILENPPLRYAWYLLLGGLLLFVIFNAKRKQRIVPIVEPLKNKSVEFVQSIGNLYLQEGDFHDMMAKKAQYFLHRVRLDYLIDTNELDEDFAKKLHLKTGKSLDKINEAIDLIKKARDPYSSVMREDLFRMNTLLDEILK